jgi:hypothetical protein
MIPIIYILTFSLFSLYVDLIGVTNKQTGLEGGENGA